MHENRRPKAQRIAFTVLTLLALAGQACGKPPTVPVVEISPETLGSWSLPTDLYDRAGTLKRLELAGEVNRVDWLRETTIEELVLHSTELSDVFGLPPTLRLLDLCNTPIDRIGLLPPRLEALSLRYTGVQSVHRLPGSLLRLSLAGVALPGRVAFPAHLQTLELELNPQRENPAKLPALPESLRTLALRANGITELPKRLPRGLRALALEGTDIEVLPAVGDRLEYLALLDNQNLRRIDWPPRVRELNLDTLERESLTTVPKYLRTLVLWNINGFDVGPLASQLVTLELQRTAGTRWSDLDQLRALRLIRTNHPPPELPATVEVLSLGEGVEIDFDRLATLAPVLRRLSVVLGEGIEAGDAPLDLSALEGLEELQLLSDTPVTLAALPTTLDVLVLQVPDLGKLPPLPDDLTVLDLSGSTGLGSLPARLPSSLSTLILRGTDLGSLPPLPETLQILDVSGTSLDDLSRPLQTVETLRSLTLDLGQIETLQAVPLTLSSLAFRSTEPERICPQSTLETLGW